MASALSDSNIPTTLAAAAYQAASVWRVSSNRKEDKGTSLFNSPDPHISRGVIHQNLSNWLWRMNVYWGLSVRVCLGPIASQDCMWTAPVVQVNDTAFGILLVAVPYRMPGEEPAHVAYGSYLTNFASNARTNACLGISNKGYKLCNMMSPMLLVPDIISYLGVPSLQCACSKHVCVVDPELPDSEGSLKVGPFESNTSACERLKSFWHWVLKEGSDDNQLILSSYDFREEVYLDFPLTLDKPSLRNASTISEVDNDTLARMQEVTSCVENLLQMSDPGMNETAFMSQCNVTLADNMTLGGLTLLDLQHRLVLDSVTKTVYRNKEVDNVTCGGDVGQAAMQEHICVQRFGALNRLQDSLKSFGKVVDIHRLGEHMWEKGASKRHQVYIGIMTALLTLLVTIAGMMCRKWQQAESWVIEHVPWLRQWTTMAVVRTLIRAGVILGFTIFNLFTLRSTIDDNKSEQALATAATIFMSLARKEELGASFLVTTTSTIEVTPTWIAFYAFCSGMGVVLVGVIVYIYLSMSKLVKSHDEHVAAAGSLEEEA